MRGTHIPLTTTFRQSAKACAIAGALALVPVTVRAADVDLSSMISTPNPRLGLSFPGSKTTYYSAIAQAGIGVVRISASWARLEPRKGRYDFSGLDRRVAALQNLGIAPFITFESNADWATIKRTQRVKNAAPKNPEQWQDFVTRVVERYDGDGHDDMPGLRYPVKYWQAANEWVSESNKSGGWIGSTDDLIRYVNMTREAVKSADPNATFVMGGMASFNADVLLVARDNRNLDVQQSWSTTSKTVLTLAQMRGPEIQSIIDNRVLPVLRGASFDMSAVHLYGPEDRDIARLKFMRQLTDRPVLSSECGGPTLDYDRKYTDAGHFRAVIERNLNVFAAGARFCLWFRLGESGGTTFGNRRTGLYDTNAEPKPGVFAYRALARLIDGKARVDFDRQNHYTIRRGAGQKITVAWGSEAAALQQGGSEMLCLANPKKGLMSSDPKKCDAGAMTFSGAGLFSLFAS